MKNNILYGGTNFILTQHKDFTNINVEDEKNNIDDLKALNIGYQLYIKFITYI
jgi:hypothetical protein